MARLTADVARALAPEVKGLGWYEARDRLDTLTGGDLEAWQLDTLTDWATNPKAIQKE